MSKRQSIMLLLWCEGPKTAEEIAEHMQMPWRDKLVGDVRCVVKEKLLYCKWEDGNALYGLTILGREYCLRNYRDSLKIRQDGNSAQGAASPTADGKPEENGGIQSDTVAAADAQEEASDGDVELVPHHVEIDEQQPAAACAIATADDENRCAATRSIAVVYFANGIPHSHTLDESGDWRSEVTRLAEKYGSTVSVYRVQLIGKTRQHVVFEEA